ncbi:MAG: tRNA pseudouridine(38-40) synthase TruA [Oscillospiraceae bacterium]|nr:tRNA pseudouridine(38-40) synthase TruA [Oscillospiraceae bacterium]
MNNIAIRLSYDGSAYHGWQVQKTKPTVALTLENALSEIYGRKIKVTGCGRTDAGVHALCYCANFSAENTIPIDRIPYAVNSLLPPDIVVSAATYVPDDFCSIRSCRKKEYIYKILNSGTRDPFLRNRACFYPAPLDFDRLSRSAAAFEGTHDFAAVRSVGTDTKTTVRTVYRCEAEKKENLITVYICADGFLYNMARAIVGTMVWAARGKFDPEHIPGLLLKGERRLTGPTMPPQGLYLSRLWYDGAAGEMTAY